MLPVALLLPELKSGFALVAEETWLNWVLVPVVESTFSVDSMSGLDTVCRGLELDANVELMVFPEDCEEFGVEEDFNEEEAETVAGLWGQEYDREEGPGDRPGLE